MSDSTERDAALYEVRCCGCGGTITFRGEEAQIMRSEGQTRSWCDNVCMRGSGIRFRWQPDIDSATLREMERTVKARRKLVSEHRR